jgi:hypothetical protein
MRAAIMPHPPANNASPSDCAMAPRTATSADSRGATVVDAAALRADVVTLDALARLARAARRADRQLVIDHASTELTTLLTLTGFTETLLSIGD